MKESTGGCGSLDHLVTSDEIQGIIFLDLVPQEGCILCKGCKNSVVRMLGFEIRPVMHKIRELQDLGQVTYNMCYKH